MPTDLIDTARHLSDKSFTVVNDLPPAIDPQLEALVRKAYDAWLVKSPSTDTRSNYQRDLAQFLAYHGYDAANVGKLVAVEPHHIANWRDYLATQGLTNSSIRRKMTVLRSLFSYLQSYGCVRTNPAHSHFVAAPPAPRDGKTVALTVHDCRRLLNAPVHEIIKTRSDGSEERIEIPAAIRDRAMLAVLAYTGCRVGELTRLKVASYKSDGVHQILEIHGKGGKERKVPLNKKAEERLEAWLEIAGIRDSGGPMFRPLASSRGHGKDGFAPRALSRRTVQKLVQRYVEELGLDRNVTVHSFRVTALTTAREQGSDIIDLQDFAGHADPRTTLTYIRNRERLSESPAYRLTY